MTYLDPAARVSKTSGQTALAWTIRALAIAAILAIGWFGLTVGLDDQGRTEVVAEPVVTTR